MNEVITAIYNLFKAEPANDFYTAVSGKLYPYKVPDETARPYAVQGVIVADPDLNFTDENREVDVQISVFSDDDFEAGQLLDKADALFQDCTLTVSGWTFLGMTLETITPNNSFLPKATVYGYNLDFTVFLEKTRS